MTLGKLQATLGWQGDATLLEQALRHRSQHAAHNERLEFVGDRALNLAVAAWLYRLQPHAAEGELSLVHTALVRAEACAEVAMNWGLWPLLKVANAPGLSQPSRQRLLADATEAVLGALYLHQGMAAVQAVVERDWVSFLNRPSQTKDAKTALQEILQAQGHALPEYQVLQQQGPDHAASFTVEVRCALGRAHGMGPSKQAASMAAAAALLTAPETGANP